MLPFQWSIVRLKQCPSTNSELARQIRENTALPGTIIITQKQTSGRGRLDRTWISPEGNLAMSLALPNPLSLDKIFQLNLVAGLALVETLRHLNPLLPIMLKWPNDVLIDGKKLAGILSEAVPEKNLAIIGVGVNLNSTLENFPEELKPFVTTLKDRTGSTTDENLFLENFLTTLKNFWKILETGKLSELLPRLNTTLAWKNRLVRVRESETIFFEGEVLGIDNDGFLKIKTGSGQDKTVIAGDVQLC